MDRMLYVAMSGAKHLFHKQEVLAHNLANANTTGFRAELDALRAVPAQGEGAGTRVFSVASTPGFDSTPGTLQQTGNPLDVAIEGDGWLAVQGVNGNEAYTRNGAMVVGADTQLRTKSGDVVMGDGGPITVPEGAKVSIARDSTVSVTQGRTTTNAGRLSSFIRRQPRCNAAPTVCFAPATATPRRETLACASWMAFLKAATSIW